MAGPEPMSRGERLELAKEIADRALSIYGPRIKAVGLYGSMARSTDGPFSDIEIFCVLRSEGEEFSYEWSYGPGKAEVDFYSEDVLLRRAAQVEGRWPLTHGAYQSVMPLYDPEEFFARLKAAACSQTDRQFHHAICEVLVGELYEFAGKWRNARASGYTAHLPSLAAETAKYGAMVIGLHNRRTFSTGSRVLEEALTMQERPAGFDSLAKVVMAGELSEPGVVHQLCEAFWDGLITWAEAHGYELTSAGRIPF